jgi:anti-sigma regulatory factor (Ser/Thr protein kinase)
MRTMISRLLPPGPTALRLARRALQDLPPRMQPVLPSLELLVSELVTNSVKHALLLPSDHVALEVMDADDYLRVEVRDPGRAYDDARAGWRGARNQGDGAGQRAQGGLGLVLVREEANRPGVGLEDGTTLAWFEITVEPEA